MTRIALLNGPNLNLLGEREPGIYGSTRLDAVKASCVALAGSLGVEVLFRQSNHEGALIDIIHEERTRSDALVINPAGLSFHSVSLLDALRIFPGPIIELHISNIHARDEHHRHSIQSAAVTGVICGLGAYGYLVALLSAAKMVGTLPDDLPRPLRTGPQG